MTLKNFMVIGASLFFFNSKPVDPYPQAQITNGLIKARLYLPDSKTGFYRGTRFDWAGVMPELEYRGHTYFGKWYSKEHDPAFHDHIAGPVEEFVAVGYETAKVGETFLKVGVGMLVKPEESKYSFANTYKNVNSGTWKVKNKADQVEFTHVLTDALYAYEYKKTVQLVKGSPELMLSHTLKNTGKQAIETNVYNHNFFVMDQQPISSDFVIIFPFTLTSETAGTQELGRLMENKILFDRELINNEHLFYSPLKGYSNSAKDYDIKIENRKTGAGVRIIGDQPLSKLVFWSAPKTVCPEPYIHISIAPGETAVWSITYQFYSTDPSLK